MTMLIAEEHHFKVLLCNNFCQFDESPSFTLVKLVKLKQYQFVHGSIIGQYNRVHEVNEYWLHHCGICSQ